MRTNKSRATLSLSSPLLARIDDRVRARRQSRSAVVEDLLERALRQERHRAIEDDIRAFYAEATEEDQADELAWARDSRTVVEESLARDERKRRR